MTIITADIIAAAQAGQAKYGIPASVSAAQWAIESGYGRHMPAGSFNPFGIKAVAGQPRVMAMTSEFLHGRWVRVMQPFRKFPSFVEAFEAHAKLLAEGRYYVKARKKLPDANAFADALTGVYATAPNYGAVLKATMRAHDLYRFDRFDVGLASAATAAGGARVLHEGMEGEDVKALQTALNRVLGLALKDDGDFGEKTDAAVRDVQRANGLKDDGIVGKLTRAALGI